MKKILSIALSAALLLTTFGGLTSVSAGAEQAAEVPNVSSAPETILLKDFSTEESVQGLNGYVFDNTTFGEPCAKVNMTGTDVYGRPGATVDIVPDASKLDYNTKYKLRATLRFTGAETDRFRVIAIQKANVDGSEVQAFTGLYGQNNVTSVADIWGSATVNVNAGFTEYTFNETVMPYGSDYRLWLFTSAGLPDESIEFAGNSADAGIYIKKLELVPVEESIVKGGSVKLTGIDNGKAVYTATPDSGYKVGNIIAQGLSTNATQFVYGIKATENSNGSVSFTVDHEKGTNIATNWHDNDTRYINVTFDKADEDAVVIEEFNVLRKGVIDVGRSLETENVYSGDNALKVDLSSSRYPSSGRAGVELNLYPDMNRLDVNTKYRLRITARSDNELGFHSLVRFHGKVDGTDVTSKWNIYNGDDVLLMESGTKIGSKWTQFTAYETFQPFGNDFYINLFIQTSTADPVTGNLWIDKVELVPIDDGIDDGVVRVTGKDEAQSTIYTAYANEGFTVDEITATVYAIGSNSPIYLDVKEISRSADNRTVEFTVAALGDATIVPYGAGYDHSTVMSFNGRYITVLFGADKPVFYTADDSYIVSDFEDNTYDFYGNSEPIDDGGLNTGKCYKSSADFEQLYFLLDANTIHKFDASANYKLSALIQSDDEWAGAIDVCVASYLQNRKVSVLSDLFVGEFGFMGVFNPNQEQIDSGVAFLSPGADMGWTEYSLQKNYAFPVVGESVWITLRIKRTSGEGSVYIDNIALTPNTDSQGFLQPADYSQKHGYVKTHYDAPNERLVFTPVAFEGYTLENLSVKLRTWGGITIDGVEYSNTLIEMKQTELVSASGERSFAVDTTHAKDDGDTLRFQSHWNMGNLCEASFKEGSAEPIVIKGDANGNGVLDLADLVRVKKYLVDSSADIKLANADMDGNGVVNSLDLTAIRIELLK